MPNPYFFTHAVATPEMFYGRREELNEIVEGILAPGFGAKSYAVIGGYRMGKTSLLLGIRQELLKSFPDNKSCVVGPVFLSTQEIPVLSQTSICQRVVQRLRDEVCAVRGWSLSGDELDDDNLPDTEAIPRLEAVLRSAIQGISSEFRLVILLDEVDLLIGKEWSPTFFSLLRNLVSVGELAPHVSVVIAGTVAIHELYKIRGSPFFNVLAAIKTLRLLDDADARSLIVEPNVGNQEPPSNDVAEEVLRQTGGHPFLIQYLMSDLWTRHKGALNRLQPADVGVAVRRYLRDRRDFQLLSEGFGEKDMLAYDEIASQSGVRVSKNAVRARVGGLKTANNALDMLVHCGVVREVSALEFVSGGEMFRNWFYENVGVPGGGNDEPVRAAALTSPPAPASPRATREVIKVFVASPGDVDVERQAVKAAVDALNGNVADENGFVLQSVMWETKSRPGLALGGAQAWLNRILEIERVDLVIGIFWQRFGTPTEHAGSGTEEEIRLAVQAWRDSGGRKPQVMLYFSDKPAAPARSRDAIEQLGKVADFRQEVAKIGLLGSYKDEQAFGELIRRNLTDHILEEARNRRNLMPARGQSGV